MASEESPATHQMPKRLEDLVEFYKGIALPKQCMTEIEDIEQMEIRDDDIWVCAFPRSGTTLTQELVFLVKTLDFERANSIHLDERFPIIEVLHKELPFYGGLEMIKKTPISKIIYSARNFHDVLWSKYNFDSFLRVTTDQFTFEEYFEKFMSGIVYYAPWDRHVREFWDHRNDGNILFLMFEDTVKDMPGTVRKIAEFLNRELTDEDINKICDHCNIENMKKNKMTNFVYFKEHMQTNEHHGDLINTGSGGAWHGKTTEEMDRRIDKMIENSFAGCGLTFKTNAK